MGNIDVGNKTAARNPGQPIIERLARTDGALRLRIEAPNTARMKRPGKLWRDVAAVRRQRQLLDAAEIRPAGGLP